MLIPTGGGVDERVGSTMKSSKVVVPYLVVAELPKPKAKVKFNVMDLPGVAEWLHSTSVPTQRNV